MDTDVSFKTTQMNIWLRHTYITGIKKTEEKKQNYLNQV